MAKLFLGGLPQNCNTEAVREYFGQFGTLTDAVCMEGRGFGFVTFETAEEAASVLTMEHVIEGRRLDVKDATAEGTKGKPKGKGGGGGGGGFVSWNSPAPAYGGKGGGGYGGGGAFMGGKGGGKAKGGCSTGPPGPVTDKIFVGGLPPDCPDQALIDYFSMFGTLVDAVVMKDKATGQPRGFGFVQFDNTDSADQVMNHYDLNEINGKWIECKRATPQDQMPAKGKGGGKGFGGGYGGGYGAAMQQFGAAFGFGAPAYGGGCGKGGYGGKGYAPY